MAAMDCNSNFEESTNDAPAVRLCTFCNNTTNGYEKWLFTKPQEKGPFFPILSEIRGDCTQYDGLGRALVCVACFHHLLRQWSSFERRCIPLHKREYLLIPEERVSNFQIRKEDEIRREADRKLKEIQIREEKIKRDAEIRLALYKQREQLIKEEAGRRIFAEQKELEEIERQAADNLKEEQEKEELLKRSLEEDIEEEKQKGKYIRKEAERLLREEKLIREPLRPAGSYSTRVLIQSPEGKVYDQLELDPNDPLFDAEMAARQRTMEYDSETGRYVRIVPSDFDKQNLEDIVATKVRETESKAKEKSKEPAWRTPEAKEKGSEPDEPLDDLSIRNTNDSVPPVFVSGGLIRTEYKFDMAHKDEVVPARDPRDKRGEFAEDDIQKAGEVMKAKFREDRMKFQQDDSEGIVFSEVTKGSFDRRRSGDRMEETTDADNGSEKRARSLSLDKRLKDMEERRARLFGRTSSGVENKENIEAKTSENMQSAPESPERDVAGAEKGDGDSPKDDVKKRARSRGERNKRRLTAEEMSIKKHSGSEDDNLSKKSDEDKDLMELTSNSGSGARLKATQDSSMGSWWSSDYGADEITFTVKETTKKDENVNNNDALVLIDDAEDEEPGADTPQEEEESKVIDEVKIQKEEPKVESNLFSSYFSNNEPEDIVFSVKSSTEKDSEIREKDPEKPVPKPRGQRIFKREDHAPDRNVDTNLIQWEMKNVDEKPERESMKDEPAVEPRRHQSSGITQDGYKRKPLASDVTEYEAKRRRDEVDSIRVVRRMDIEGTIPAEETPKVQSAPSYQDPMEYDHEPGIHPAPILLSQLQDESVDDERKRKRREMEEKKRRIVENQKRASLRNQKSEERQSSPDLSSSRAADQVLPEELKEKRRSLLLMWESYADGQGPEPESPEPKRPLDPEELGNSVASPPVESQPETDKELSENIINYRTMDVDDDIDNTRAPVVEIDEHHRLNDEELRWEGAGTFQPGRLQSKFRSMESEQPSDIEYTVKTTVRYDTKSSSNGEPDVNKNSYETVQTMKSPVQEDQSIMISNSEVESAPKALWDKTDGQGAFEESDEEDYRKPHVDVDDFHNLTNDENKWDKWTGQGQPGKLKFTLFEGLHKDEKSTDGPKKVKRGDTSRYEVIKKMQRTESKKKMLIPTSLDVQVSEKETIVIEDDYDRPYVNKLDRTVLQEKDVETERRRLDEERRRSEREEIEREREEERRRLERERMEPDVTHEDDINDEYEAKVRSQNVGKINRGMFEQYQRNGEASPEIRARTRSQEEPGRSTKDRIVITERLEAQNVDRVEASPGDEMDSAPEVNERNKELEEDIYEGRIRDKAVGKLSIDLSRFSRSDAPEEPAPIIREKRVIRRQEVHVQDTPVEDTEQFQQDKMKEEVPMRKHKTSVDGVRREVPVETDYDVVVQQTVTEVESTPTSYEYDYNTDDYEVKRQSVGKLKLDWMSQAREQEEQIAEQQRREKELERIRAEKEEMERLKREHHEEEESDVFVEKEETEKPRIVKKLSQQSMSQFEGDEPKRVSPSPRRRMSPTFKEEKRQERKLARKESRTKLYSEDEGFVIEEKTTTVVESQPEEPEYDEPDYEEPRKEVGRLKLDLYVGSEDQETENRKKMLEQERARQEYEEIQRLREEEARRRTNLPSDEEDYGATAEKVQNVSKLDLSQFKQFQKEPTEEVKPRKLSVKRQKQETPPKEVQKQSREEILVSVETQQEVESAPLQFPDTDVIEKEREEAFSYDEKIKTEVRRLDVNKIIQQRQEEQRESQRRARMLEEQRLLEEKAEMERERTRRELEARGERDVERVQRNSIGDEEEINLSSAEKPQHVGKLNFNQFSQFQKETTESPPQRISTRTATKESPAREVTETQDVIVAVETQHEVESAPPQASENVDIIEREREEAFSYDERIKTGVKPLDVNRIIQQRQEEERERQRRARLLEEQRIAEEKSEMERARRELEAQGGRDAERIQMDSIGIEDEEEINLSSAEKPQNVGKLNLNQFSQFQKETIESPPQRRESTRTPQKEPPAREEVKDSIVFVESQNEVESAPPLPSGNFEDTERDEASSYDERIKYEVKRLDVNRLQQQRQEEQRESKRRAKILEEQRLREEQAEVERARREFEESARRSESEDNERYLPEEYRRIQEDRQAVTPEKPQYVNKLDLSQFSQFQKTPVEETPPRKLSVKRSKQEMPAKDAREISEEVMQVETLKEVESAPSSYEVSVIEREREEALSYDEKIKNEVKPLDVQRILQQRQEEERESYRRARMLEEQRLLEEKEEMERAREEIRRGKRRGVAHASSDSQQPAVTESRPSENEKPRRSSSEVIQSTGVEEVESEVPYEIDGSSPEREGGKSVGRLNLNRYSQSFDNEAKEAERRKRELERQRAMREREEMEKLRLEQQSSEMQASYVTTDTDRVGVNGQEASYRRAEQPNREEDFSDQADRFPDEEKPVPKRLDLSKFSPFERGDPVVLRRAKSERQMRPVSSGEADLGTWHDDSVVRRRENPEARKQRPKSIAGTTLQSQYTNGNSPSSKKVYIIN